jgi:hypothetical protein
MKMAAEPMTARRFDRDTVAEWFGVSETTVSGLWECVSGTRYGRKNRFVARANQRSTCRPVPFVPSASYVRREESKKHCTGSKND